MTSQNWLPLVKRKLELARWGAKLAGEEGTGEGATGEARGIDILVRLHMWLTLKEIAEEVVVESEGMTIIQLCDVVFEWLMQGYPFFQQRPHGSHETAISNFHSKAQNQDCGEV